MNETIDVILHRRSVRRYEPDEIPQEMLDTILQAGCAAPHGGPARPWKFLVVRKQETRNRLLGALKRGIDRACGGPPQDGYWCTFFSQAPVVVAVAFKPTSMGGADERTELGIGIASAACAIENMLLAAAALGLGACWVGPLPEAKDEFESVLGIQAPWEFLAFVPIGRPKESLRRDKPRPVGAIVQYFD